LTTLVALASKHSVVVGTDSLGTSTRRLIDVTDIFKFFDHNDEWKPRTEGDNALKDLFDLFGASRDVPYNQLLHVTKLFRLGKLPVAAMFTGITSIGTDTVRGLIAAFADQDPAMQDPTIDYTVATLSEKLLEFLRLAYKDQYQSEFQEEELELLVAGYDRTGPWPTVVRLDVRRNSYQVEFAAGEFGIAFGGQMDWIQRIVFGTDVRNQVNLQQRLEFLQRAYRERLIEALAANGYTGDIPSAESFGEELQLFHDWRLDGLETNWAEFSEQNAIDCVDFFLRIMIQAQDVSSQLPTVGGNVHIVVIRRDGFYPVTKEVWKHGEHEVATPESGRS
jgi:hypothetical protein